MKQLFFLSVFTLFLSAISNGQNTVRGKVTDENGEPVIGAPVVLSIIHSLGTTTDLDGNYSLAIPDTSPRIIVVSYIGFQTAQKEVHPEEGKIIVLNFTLKAATQAIKEVEVTAKSVKAKEYFMENIKKKSATTIDYVSSETMKKTGDANVTAAVTRVAGVSTNGAFITVRGIGDRYVKTSINGSRIPTLDPFTNNIKLDIFPASLVDNVLITKTASPDLPGDWAGAYIDIQTKDYPDQLTVNVESSAGYNSNATFKNYTSSQHSKTDWLGYDNSFRDRNHNDFSPAILSPSRYQEFVALGLGNYYNSLGVDNNTPWNDTYYKLGLVQLKLLVPALINDDAAFKAASNAYIYGSFTKDAFNIINAGAAKTGRSFPDNWNTVVRKGPMDYSENISIGNQISLFGKPLGFIAGLKYGSAVVYDPHSIAERVYAGTGLISAYQERQLSWETNGWSGLANLSYKFNPDNSIGFLFMPNYTGVNKVASSYDTINRMNNIAQYYEQRRQLVYQFKSEHYLDWSKTKIETNASYTNGRSSAPDFKELYYKGGNTTLPYFILDPTNDFDTRTFRYLKDDIYDVRLSFELPLSSKANMARKVKFGGSYQYEKQDRNQYQYHLNLGNNTNIPQTNDINALLSLDNFSLQDNELMFHYSNDSTPTNHAFGWGKTGAGFIMLDYMIVPRLRITGGMRAEHTDMFTDIFLYDSLGYAANDIRRNYKAGYPDANPAVLKEWDYLPSANLIYTIKKDEIFPVNARFNFSQTIARPSIRELTNVSEFDYELEGNVTGNPYLKTVHVNNYDVRFESYFKNGDNVSVSGFYKTFKNHIELVQSDGYYWQNVDNSHVTGVEVEGRKNIYEGFSFAANLTIADSHTRYIRTRNETVGGVTTVYLEDTVSRTMFGQAPYVVNGILSYTADSIGLTCTATYNVQGDRLVIASNNSSVPDIYERPRNVLDFKVIKTVRKHFGVSVTVKDILNAERLRSFKYTDHWTIYDEYHYGTNIIVGISYKF